MDELNQDVQMIILSYLEPHEIMTMYGLFKTMLDELSKHIGFIVNCSDIVSEQVIEWFQEHNIRLKLIETIKIDDKCQIWLLNGKRHRDNDLPAIVYKDGSKQWFWNGDRHRENDLPAIIIAGEDGAQYWFHKGRLHRDNDLPAVVFGNGYQVWYQAWYQNGEFHRDNDLPAIIWEDGSKEWWINGELHKQS